MWKRKEGKEIGSQEYIMINIKNYFRLTSREYSQACRLKYNRKRYQRTFQLRYTLSEEKIEKKLLDNYEGWVG
jgi:hypothetical protein